MVILGVLLKVVPPPTTSALPSVSKVHQPALVWAQSVTSFCIVFSNKNTGVMVVVVVVVFF